MFLLLHTGGDEQVGTRVTSAATASAAASVSEAETKPTEAAGDALTAEHGDDWLSHVERKVTATNSDGVSGF